MRTSIRVILLFVIVSFSWGCSGPPPDTDKTNELRQKLGIRTIRQEWHYCGTRRNGSGEIEQTWSSGNHGEKKATRDSNGNILREQDYYYSGRTFADFEGGTSWEKLSLCYDYRNQKFYIGIVTSNKWAEDLIEKSFGLDPAGPAGYAGTNNTETLKVADDILKSWGIPRL